MKRGDIYLASIPGDYGKPRPVVVAQNDIINDTHSSIIVCPVSSYLLDTPLFRPTIEPMANNGLRLTSQIMVDKVLAIKRDRLRKRIGKVGDDMLLQLNRSLAFWIGL